MSQVAFIYWIYGCGVITGAFLQEEREMWYMRPCPVHVLKVMALSVIHLQPLRLVLLDTLMTDYMALVDCYLSNSHYQPDELEYVDMVRKVRQYERSTCKCRMHSLFVFGG